MVSLQGGQVEGNVDIIQVARQPQPETMFTSSTAPPTHQDCFFHPLFHLTVIYLHTYSENALGRSRT